jgi:signal peptidase II
MKTSHLYFLAALMTAVALDRFSKDWAAQTLTLYESVPVLGGLMQFTLSYNTGVAFGLFSGAGRVPLVVSGLVIMVLFVAALFALTSLRVRPHSVIALGFLLGGALGNFFDRLPDLRVTDFLDVGVGTLRWPTFNLADSFIITSLFFLLLFQRNLKRSVAAGDKGRHPTTNEPH